MEQPSMNHFRPEKVFMPTSPESKEIVGRENIEFVVDSQSGKIIKIGNPRDVREWIDGKKSENPNVFFSSEDGDIVLPGMTDAHNHLVYGTLEVIGAGYVDGINSQEQILRSIAMQALEGEVEKPKIILGHNTATVPNLFREDLDSVCYKRPLCVLDLSFHGARINSAMAKILMETVLNEKREGRRVSGEFNEKTGQVTEGHALLTVQLAESFYGIDNIVEGMTKKLDGWIEQGITDIHELYPMGGDLEAMLICRKNWERDRGNEFPVRQFFMNPNMLKQLKRDQKILESKGLFNPDKDWKLMGLKLITDGSFGSHTAMMNESFSDGKGSGMEFNSVNEINNALEMVRDMGISNIAQHAIGDAAIKRALETAEKWVKMADKNNLDSTKFRIEHFEIPGGKADLDQAKSLGVWACSQPNFLTDMIYRDRLSGRVTQLCPHADEINKGIPLLLGSDGMPSSALFGIYAATHHPNPKQRISFEQALVAYSMTAADYEHNNGRGRIAEGASADIVIINKKTMNELLMGDANEQSFTDLGNNRDALNEKVNDLESGIKKVFRQGKLVKDNKK